MAVRRRDECPRDAGRANLVPVVSPDSGSTRMSVTWVAGEPGSQQALYAHAESDRVDGGCRHAA
ncbi:MAG: hypothetical protein ACJ77A_10555 [Actinomycetota bacterium]